MKVGSLFSGIGGFDLGLERAGMQIVWQSEIEPYCCQVLKRHWPGVLNLGDIYKIKNPPAVDIITGGVPCQPASCAGKRKGTADDRWLWPEALRIIHEVKPTWCILENVCGILSLEGGVVFENLLLALEAEGYEVQPFIIPACAVGAWHRRDRIWVVAYTDRSRRPERSDVSIRRQRKADPTVVSPGYGKVGSFTHTNPPGRQNSQRCSGSTGQKGRQKPSSDISQSITGYVWEDQPDVGVLVHGIPRGLDPVGALGNAIVPQIAEEIGKMIMQVELIEKEEK